MDKLSENAQKLLNVAQKRPEFSKVKDQLVAEMVMMDEMEITNDLFSVYNKVKTKELTMGDKNPLNSAMAYLLGITTVKPTKTLAHEKRRTYGRSGFPDIDMDFDYARRYEIYEYLMSKYGEEYVASIGTIGTLNIRGVVRRVIKIIDPDNGILYNEGKIIDQSANVMLQDEALGTLPDPKKPMKKKDGSLVKTITEAYQTFPAFAAYMNKYPDVYRVAQHLEGGIASYSRHAAGVVISPVPLAEICPLHATRQASNKKERIVSTQWTMNDVESVGLIKMDVLGLSTYTAIAEALKLIKMNHGIDLDLSNIPLDDVKTLALLNSGKTDGCFQAEEPGMQQTFQQIGIDSFDDLIVSIAMWRPGPMDYIPEFVKRKRGITPVSYNHPLMKKITERTFGIMAYQEQIMQVFMALADLPSSDGYDFMKGCAKKKTALIDKYKDKFFAGCKRQGVTLPVTTKIFSDMKKFGSYAFNLAHSTAYAHLSFKTAYLKAHFEIEFMAARLSVEAKRRDFEKVAKYERDAIIDGIKILPVDLNRSKMYYVKTGERELLRPLIIKDVGDKAAEEIIRHQPYKGADLMFAFATKVSSVVNKTAVEVLCDAKLFGTNKKKIQLVKDFETIKNDRKRTKGKRRGGNIF